MSGFHGYLNDEPLTDEMVDAMVAETAARTAELMGQTPLERAHEILDAEEAYEGPGKIADFKAGVADGRHPHTAAHIVAEKAALDFNAALEIAKAWAAGV